MTWITNTAHPIVSTDPDGPLTDLAGFQDIARDATIVALGVSARDTHELSVVSHRILRFLVERLGFRSLFLEGDDVTSIALDEYVRTGTGDPRTLMAEARSFWRTEELLDVVVWVREHNKRQPADPVRIVTVTDPDRHAMPQVNDLGIIERLLADNVISWQERTGHKIVYWGGIAHTANGDPRTVSPASPPAIHRSAGGHLRAHYGSRFVSVGLTFHHGSKSHPAPEPPADFAEARLGNPDAADYFVDLRADRPAWFDQPAKTRLIGPGYDPARDADFHLSGGALTDWFDALVHYREVTPAHPLKS